MFKHQLFIRPLAAALLLLAGGALGAPSAFVERAASVSGGFSFGNGARVVASLELPIDFGWPVDVSLEANAGYSSWASGPSPIVGLGAKALLFPALFGNPPVAVALELRGAAGEVQPFAAGPRFQVLPIVSLDFTPLVVNLSVGLGLLGGNVGLDGGIGLRYYFDPFALDASLNFSTAGATTAGVGVRYSF